MYVCMYVCAFLSLCVCFCPGLYTCIGVCVSFSLCVFLSLTLPSSLPPHLFPCTLTNLLDSLLSLPLSASLTPSKYQVWLGKNNFFEDEPSAQHRLVSKAIPHPDFNMSLLNEHTPQPEDDYSNDLMLLRLSKPADITDVVKPITLPTEEPKLGSTCLASGWGSITPVICGSSPSNRGVAVRGRGD